MIDPHTLAREVLDYCRRDLQIPLAPWELRVEFWELETWGEYDPATPKVVKLSERLLQREYVDLIPRAVAHEVLHLSVSLAARAGTIPNCWILDEGLNERAAEAYGQKVAERWSHR